MKFKKNISLSLSTCRSVDALWFSWKDVHVLVSLSFSLHLHLQKRFGSRSDPNGIQERMFRQLKAIESTQSVVQKPMRTIKWVLSVYIVRSHARIQRGEFLSNTGPDPLKFSKLPSQHSKLGHHRQASETPFKGVSLAGRWWPAFSDIWILCPFKQKIKSLSEFGSRSDPNGIQERMFRQFKHLGIESMLSINTVEYPTLSCKSRCAREASPSIMFSTDTVCTRLSLSLSLSLSLYHLLSKFENSLDPKDLRRLAKPNQGQTGIPRINHVSELPTLSPMPRKNIIN